MKVFITGASSGLGEALARHYAKSGAVLGLLGRREVELTRVAQTLASSTNAVYVADVRDAAAVARAADDFIARFGVPDVVIGSAGISIGTASDHPEDNAAFRAIFDTNVLGLLHTFQPFLPSMMSLGSGTLVGISSVAGFRGIPGSGPYSASKAAAISYLESLRVELVPSGICVVTVCPGYVKTAMTAVNPYRMPFLLDADKAARLTARAIERRKRFYVFPWQMALIARAIRALPRPVYDAVFSRAPRKPRAS